MLGKDAIPDVFTEVYKNSLSKTPFCRPQSATFNLRDSKFQNWNPWNLEFEILGIWHPWNLESLEFGILGIWHP